MRPSTVSRAHAVVRLRAAVEATPTVWRRADLVARWSDHTVNAAVRAGVIRRIGPALYVATAHLGTTDWHASAAGRWSEPTGIVSGCAALWLHGVTAEPPTVATVAVPHTFKRPALPFVRVRRSTVSIRAIVIEGLRAAPLPDAIIHAWEETPRCERVGFIIDAIRIGGVSVATLRARIDTYPRIRGRRALENLLDVAAGGVTSYLEYRARSQVFRSNRFATFIWQAPLRLGTRKVVIDMLDPEARVAVEFDGRAFHNDDAARRRDLERDALLAARGYVVLRFTYEDVMTRPAWCRTQVMGAVRARLPAAA